MHNQETDKTSRYREFLSKKFMSSKFGTALIITLSVYYIHTPQIILTYVTFNIF